MNGDNVTYFHKFGVEHIPKEIKKFLGNKNNAVNIYVIQVDDSIICQYFCIRFINFVLKEKGLLDYTNIFSPEEYEKNDKLILTFFNNLKLNFLYV